MKKILFFIFSLDLISIVSSYNHEFDKYDGHSEDVIVSTKYGSLNGFKYQMTNGKNANIFLGVPYASPPVDDLKLEKPIPPLPWKETIQTKKFPPQCSPHTGLITKWLGPHSEDCLYLNIFSPEEPSTDPEGYPVAIWIHGGGFCFGETEGYGFKTLSDNFVAKGIIIVSIQYRLGPFGFFSLGDEIAPGNLGLWDQRQALLFLHEILDSFNGNKNKITVWGHSAGGTSTSLLTASPHSRDLFQQEFQLSGSAFAEWGNHKRVINISKILAENLGCMQNNDSKMTKKCVKQKSTEEIHKAADKMGLSPDELNFDYYHPVADVEWFGKNYLDVLKEAPKKPALIGVTSAESLLCSSYIPESLATMFSIHMGYKKEEQSSFTKEMFEEFISKKIVKKEYFGDDTEAAINDLIEYYIDRGTDKEKKNPRFYFNRYTDLLSDIQFTIPTIKDGLEKSKLNWSTYIYLFDWVNPELAEAAGYYGGANHGLEIAYIHGFQIFYPFKFIKADHQVKELYVNGIANFFKYGNPSGNGITWPRMSKTHEFEYMHLAKNSKIDDKFFKHRLDFWDKFNQKYNFDLIRGEFKNSKKFKDEL